MRRLLLILFILSSVAACGGSKRTGPSVSATSTSSSISGSSPTAPTSSSAPGCESSTTIADSKGGAEVNPPGDIPDNQAFVMEHPSGGGYVVKVPEGWTRSESTDHVTFTDKLNTIDIRVMPVDVAPTVESAERDEVPALTSTQTCFSLVRVREVKRRAGQMILVLYRANSAADPVTGKVLRDDVERYEIWRDGRQATITLSGPMGSDNVDPWRIVTDSFTWT